jgi:hypothetical protein
MRKLVVLALAGILTLAVTAVAIGATANSGTTVQTYDQTYSQKRTNKSTGTTFKTTSTDDTNTARNRQPKRVTNFDITFPAGSKINSKGAAQCKADENDFANADDPDDACPRGSKLGSGAVAARLPFDSPIGDVDGNVTAYNANKGLLLFVNLQEANQTLLLKPKFRGRRLLTTVPHSCVPPNRPDNGCRDASGTEQSAVLVSFNLKTGAKSTGRGRSKRNLITTPRTCPRGGWTFEADIKYADGERLNIEETSPCR